MDVWVCGLSVDDAMVLVSCGRCTYGRNCKFLHSNEAAQDRGNRGSSDNNTSSNVSRIHVSQGHDTLSLALKMVVYCLPACLPD